MITQEVEALIYPTERNLVVAKVIVEVEVTLVVFLTEIVLLLRWFSEAIHLGLDVLLRVQHAVHIHHEVVIKIDALSWPEFICLSKFRPILLPLVLADSVIHKIRGLGRKNEAD